MTAFGAPWAYLLWWGGYLFVYPLVTRLRFMGEHGVAVDRLSADARENTATTLVSLWERILIAPNFVNYHLEHHMYPTVPFHALPAMASPATNQGRPRSGSAQSVPLFRSRSASLVRSCNGAEQAAEPSRPAAFIDENSDSLKAFVQKNYSDQISLARAARQACLARCPLAEAAKEDPLMPS